MAVIEQNSMPFKPYARLMNILGDQLITNKIVAVIEILKNCYDADSSSAEIRFCNLSNILVTVCLSLQLRMYGCVLQHQIN